MLTVEDINKTFADKGLHIKLPLPDQFLVKKMDILERKTTAEGIGLLLNISFVNDQGQEVSDLIFCEGKVDWKATRPAKPAEIKQPPKKEMLPLRSKETFDNEEEGMAYLKEAMGHLLSDKGYRPGAPDKVDMFFENEGNAFYLNVAVRCDETAWAKAKNLAELRQGCGLDHEYGLVVPAFQESLGISLLNQDRWIWRNQEYLANNRIGVYAVDNWNPNMIYAFSIHPRPRELRRYFMTTGSQWQMIRSRYVANRSQRRREAES